MQLLSSLNSLNKPTSLLKSSSTTATLLGRSCSAFDVYSPRSEVRRLYPVWWTLHRADSCRDRDETEGQEERCAVLCCAIGERIGWGGIVLSIVFATVKRMRLLSPSCLVFFSLDYQFERSVFLHRSRRSLAMEIPPISGGRKTETNVLVR